jgi:hypothetical protein
MSVRVKNVGCITYSGGSTIWKGDTIQNQTYGEVGTVRVVYEGIEYVFGPNDTKTFADDGIGKAVDAADARLRIIDDRDGAQVRLSSPSVVVRTY